MSAQEPRAAFATLGKGASIPKRLQRVGFTAH